MFLSNGNGKSYCWDTQKNSQNTNEGTSKRAPEPQHVICKSE